MSFIRKRKYNSQKIVITSNNIKNNNHKNKNLNNSKSETKCDTNSRINSVFSDRNINQKNNKDIFEFTFSNTNFVKNIIKKEEINLHIRNSHINKTNTNYSYHKKNNGKNIINIKKNIGIKNITVINNKNNLNDKNIKHNKERFINIRNFSRGEKYKRKNTIQDKQNKKIKNNSRKNINKTSKIPKKFISLIPHENPKIKKNFSINTNDEMSNKNYNDISNTPKNKNNQNQIHKLLLNISQKEFIRINKSNPKIRFMSSPLNSL